MSLSGLKRLLVGKSLPTSAHAEERLSNAAALAVLSSDALSSVAYATEEILEILVAAGSVALSYSLPIAGMIMLLLAILVVSYSQTIKAYPNSGGAYIVAKENLGLLPGLVAGGSLMIDYILTVTVSVSAGIAALTSAVPSLKEHSVLMCLLSIFLIMLANLRGVKESGNLFMIPTYSFIVSIFLLVGVGIYQQMTGNVPTDVTPHLGAENHHPITEQVTLFFLLRAFSAGCSALTGVEAISNGVPAFKPVEWKNARITLMYMALILGCMFIGTTYLANSYQIIPSETETAVSQLGTKIFGAGSFLYYSLQIATLFILLLAANTSYADFPRLCSFISGDGFLPRQLSILGDRLVYSNGIIFLSAAAALLVIIFKADVGAIIPLYAVGVFTSFTLSQAGMVVRWFRLKTPGWQASAILNGLGALATFVVLVVIILTKFLVGAWLVVVTIPIVVAIFLRIRSHYKYVAERLSVDDLAPRSYTPRPRTEKVTHPAIVIVGHLNRGTVEALDYARSIADEIIAIHVDIGNTDREKLRARWEELESDIQLEIINSPFRSLIEPIVDFITNYEKDHPDVLSTIIIPAFVTRNWWEGLLHNQTTLFIKAALLGKRSRVVTTVRYYL
jgi:amino acid transporter